MPRRTVTRCGRRVSNDTQLDQITELNLTTGDCFEFGDFLKRVEFTRPWARWRDELTARWIDAYPGSRPMAAYIVGEIPPPAWQHDLPGLRRPLRPISGVDVVIADTGWHRLAPELDHLVALGIVDDDELELAEIRLASVNPIASDRYRSIAAPERAGNNFNGSTRGERLSNR